MEITIIFKNKNKNRKYKYLISMWVYFLFFIFKIIKKVIIFYIKVTIIF